MKLLKFCLYLFCKLQFMNISNTLREITPLLLANAVGPFKENAGASWLLRYEKGSELE